MISRRQFIASATVWAIATADSLGLTDEAVASPALRTVPTAPARPKNLSQPVAKGVWNKARRESSVTTNRHFVDQWIGTKANGTLLDRVEWRDVLAERYGPLVVSGGANEIVMERVWSLNAVPSPNYGVGLLTVSGPVGRMRIEDFKVVGGSPSPPSSKAMAAICMWGKWDEAGCSNWEIKRGVIDNLFMTKSSKRYENIDGISLESGWTDGLIEDIRIDGVSDAGIDLKGNNCRINMADISNARENLKLWRSSERHGAVVSRNPRFAHIISAGRDGQNIFEYFEAHSAGRPLVAFEGPGNIHFRTLACHSDQKISTGNGKVTWDQRIDL